MTSAPTEVNTASNDGTNLASRSRIRNRTPVPASSRSVIRLRAAWVSHCPLGWAVTARIQTRRVARATVKNTYRRFRVTVSTWNTSHATIPAA
jgi:hypothetical protein